MDLRGFYERIYERYPITANPFPGDGRQGAALDLLVPGTKLLDVGCGDGAFLRLASPLFRECYDVDISPSLVEAVRKAGFEATCVDLNEESLPFPDGFFDAVTTLDVIEHIFDPYRFIQELRRVLRNGGRLIIATPNLRYISHLVNLVVRGRAPRTAEDTPPCVWDGGHLHYFTATDLRELLRSENLTVQKTIFYAAKGLKATRKWKLLNRLLNHRLGREFLWPGIAVVATRE